MPTSISPRPALKTEALPIGFLIGSFAAASVAAALFLTTAKNQAAMDAYATPSPASELPQGKPDLTPSWEVLGRLGIPEHPEAFIDRDATGFALVYLYFDDESGRRESAR